MQSNLIIIIIKRKRN